MSIKVVITMDLSVFPSQFIYLFAISAVYVIAIVAYNKFGKVKAKN